MVAAMHVDPHRFGMAWGSSQPRKEELQLIPAPQRLARQESDGFARSEAKAARLCLRFCYFWQEMPITSTSSVSAYPTFITKYFFPYTILSL
jgi:hypothetical protein